jgi:transcription antitermination protein NusB
MGYRRRSRELAMQALFFMDIQGSSSEDMVELFIENFKPAKKMVPFFLTLLNGVVSRKNTIDTILEQISSNWRVGRMACVDRNIIRVAIYELCFLGDVPSKVAINEAIDIGKRYGTEESGAFINGVLDSVLKLLESGEIKADRDPIPMPI